ncbi:hypothetical protein KYC5002_35350 [Archangium violaceum]|uniref:hypothetical protein n=1 Tax=Archangium violaceum TaxID=83451 RepID=UPI002B285D5A|nr:hypothetical protein KYC5002_35350 [Archangium gephyra]
MGYLFYADALGMQSLLQINPRLAEAALNSIYTHAAATLNTPLPKSTKRPKDDPDHSLIIFNDSIFLYCQNLPAAVHYAAQLTYKLFTLEPKKGGPIALRGTIIETKEHPNIRNDQGSEGLNIQASRLTLPNIGSALIADKKRVLGARIIIHKTLLENSDYQSWDYRLQAKIMHLTGMAERFQSDLLKTDQELRNHCDIAWMNVPSNSGFSNLLGTIQNFAYLAAFNQRAALHAAATLGLYRATESRRHGIVVILRKLWAGISKGTSLEKQPAPKDDYEGWLEQAAAIKQHNQKLYFPIDTTTMNPPTR